MARLMQGIIAKHNLMKQPLIVVNKSGGAGGEGFLDVKEAKGDPHKLIITLSNLFTTPLATGVPFNWKDLTPVAMLALDEFVLWVNADTPYKTAKEYLDAVKAAARTSSRWAAPARSRKTRSSPSRSRRRPAPSSPTCRSRAAATSRCSWSASTSTRRVNNPIEAVAQWRAGKLRPLCVFDEQRMPTTTTRSPTTMSWNDIPTCKEAGRRRRLPDAARHLHAAGRRPRTRSTYYVDLFKKVRETPDWKKFMEDGAFNTTFMTGAEYANWVDEGGEACTDELMKEAGFLAK